MEEYTKEFDRKNRDVIERMLNYLGENNNTLSHSIHATMAQFLHNFMFEIVSISKEQQYISAVDIIDSQIKELRQCVIDLEAYKQRLMTGVIAQ